LAKDSQINHWKREKIFSISSQSKKILSTCPYMLCTRSRWCWESF